MMNTVVMTQSTVPANIADIIMRTLNASNTISRKLLEANVSSKPMKKEIKGQLNKMDEDLKNYAIWSSTNAQLIYSNQALVQKLGEMGAAVDKMLENIRGEKKLFQEYLGSKKIRQLAEAVRSLNPRINIGNQQEFSFGGNQNWTASANTSFNIGGTQTMSATPAGLLTSATYGGTDGLAFATGNTGGVTNVTQTMTGPQQVPNAFMLGSNNPMGGNMFQQTNMGMQPNMMGNMMMGTNQMQGSPMQTQMMMPNMMVGQMQGMPMQMQNTNMMQHQMSMQGQMMPQQQMMPQGQMMGMQNNNMMMQGMMPSGM